MYSNELVVNILNYLDNNLYSHITIDLLSRTFCYDKTYLMKKFKKELSISIISYINSIKIYKSLSYFKNDDLILKISYKSGFNSLEYFSETFKNIIGVSPLEYKDFISYNPKLSEEKIELIKLNLSKLEVLINFIKKYKQNIKPQTNPVKRISIFK